MKALLRGTLATLVGSVSLFVASTALADGEACYNDDDCPGTACGDAVCNWTKTAKMPMGDKGFACNPAGSQTPVGRDGWCTTDDDCKCKALGATCQATTASKQPYCTFTRPQDAPGAAGGSGSGGSGTAGTTSSTAGTTATAGTATTPTAGTTSKPAEEESGGCSVSMPGSSNSALALGVGLVGLGFALARRRRS